MRDTEFRANQKFFTQLFSDSSVPSPIVDANGRTRVPASGGHLQFEAYLLIKDSKASVLNNWPQTNIQIHGSRQSLGMFKGFSDVRVAQQYAMVSNRTGVPNVFNVPRTKHEAFTVLRGIKPGVYLDR